MRALSYALVFTVVATLSVSSAFAASTQQTKMTNCNAEASAKKLSGDARKSFMSSCLSSASAQSGTMTKTQSSATSKAQSCASQADAKKLSGAARTSFVNKCAAG